MSFADFSHSINRSIYRWIYALIFIIPLNFFIIGGGYVVGIQWAFVRFQVSTDYGPSIIPVTHSLSWVITGVLTGRSAVSQVVFFLAVTGLVISFLLLLSPDHIWIKKAGLITLVSGILLIISAILQYGLFLYGSSGILIPVGIPLILVLGSLLYTSAENKSNGSIHKERDGIPGPDTPVDQKTSESTALENDVIKNRLFPFVSENKELIILSVITILFFSRIFLHPDQIIVSSGKNFDSDVILQFSFWCSFFASSILQGSGIPLWNPFVFSGTPFIGNPLSGIFYPFSWLFLFFNSDVLFGYFFIIDILLIGFFTYFYAREISLNKFGSLISAVTFMFCGAIIPRIFAGHLPNINALVWFPLALLFYERTSKSGKFLPSICAGISFGLMILAGNIQFALYGIVVAVMYVVLRVLLSDDLPLMKNKISRLVIILFISLTVCGMVSAVQLLPTWEYSQLSNRAGGVSYDFSTELSLPPSNMITLLVPDYFGSVESTLPFPRYYYWEFSLYLGILPLVLAMAGLLFHKNRYRFIFGGLALFALLFSFGTYAPLYDVFFHYVPGFSMFRNPSSMLFVFTFMAALLAGFGGEVIITSLAGKEKKRYLLFRNGLLVLAFFSVVLQILMIAGWKMPRSSAEITDGYLIFITLFCLSVIIIYLKDTIGIDKGWLQRILIAILVLDLFCFGMHFIDTRPSEQIFKNPAYLPVFQNETDPYFRIYDTTGTLNQNLAYRNNLYLVNGYDPTYLKSYQKFFVRSFGKNNTADIQSDWWVDSESISDPDILRLLNVRYIVTEKPEDISGTECVYHDRVFVYRLNSTYPRAYIIAAKEFGNTSPVVTSPAKITGYSPNTITIEAETNEESYLVMSEIWYPGWVARDNNMTVEILKNQDIFRAVKLTPGNHEISFTYFPKIFTVF